MQILRDAQPVTACNRNRGDFGSRKLRFHEERLSSAERTQFAFSATAVTGETLPAMLNKIETSIMKKILYLFFAFLIISCGAKMTLADKQNVDTSFPQLNQISTGDVGVTLVSKEKGSKHKALVINEDRKVKPGNLIKELNRGEIFINQFDTKKYELYSSPKNINFGIAVPKNGGEQMFYINDGAGAQIVQLNSPINCSETTAVVKEDQYFKQEFIYNGKIGTGLKFTYREFVDNTARPAFTQDLQYDLAESNIIGFRGLRVEIINATNMNIQYKVISQF